jgi:DNA-binding transcriptional MerR regulator
VASHHPIRKLVSPELPVIPDKLYFRIGDVAHLCEVPAYVLRFWETEFSQLKPNKGGTGQRLYRKRDVEMALRIKSLLYDQGYTIAGARQVFLSESKTKEAPETTAHASSAPPQPAEAQPTIDVGAAIRQDAQHREQLCTLRDELRSLASLLAKPVSAHPAPAAIENTPPESPPAKAKPLRPRLVLEPKPDARSEHKSEPHLLNQGDLFPSE